MGFDVFSGFPCAQTNDFFLGEKCVREQVILTSMCFLNLQTRKAPTAKQVSESDLCRRAGNIAVFENLRITNVNLPLASVCAERTM
jgi:hypothetical protein